MQNTGTQSTGSVEPPFCDAQSDEKESSVSSRNEWLPFGVQFRYAIPSFQVDVALSIRALRTVRVCEGSSRTVWRPCAHTYHHHRSRRWQGTTRHDHPRPWTRHWRCEVHRAPTLGVHLLAGTDITIAYTYPGFSLHDELKLFVEAGLTPMQALETATTNPSLFLGLSKTWGRVEPGYTANLVVLDADPLADISNMNKIDSVVVSGQRLDRAQLDQLLNDAKIDAGKSSQQ
jgi:hypothetical protein